MKVTVRITGSFVKAAKPLLKKYPSLSKDLLQLEDELIKNPKPGTALGNNIYKIRLTISSKGKGQERGARVISLVETTLVGQLKIKDEETTVNLLTIYDKADASTITDKELKELIKAYSQNKESLKIFKAIVIRLLNNLPVLKLQKHGKMPGHGFAYAKRSD